MPLLQRLPRPLGILAMWLLTFAMWTLVRTLMSLDANPVHGALWSAVVAAALWFLIVRKR